MKKYFSTWAFISLLMPLLSFAQPNLIVSQSSLQSPNISTGNYLQINFKIKNAGNVAAIANHAKIYLSATATLGSGAIALNDISCEALAAGQETNTVNYLFPLPYKVNPGSYYVFIKADSRSKVAETDENNNFSLSTQLLVNNNLGGQQNLSYPIIFIHGLNSDQTTWDPLITDLKNNFGWSYGGNLNFCLNQDGNINTANLTTDYKDWTDVGSLTAKDFYTLNFNVSPTGTAPADSYESNQSAISKQGLAVRDAIAHVLQLTGKTKVILVCHSMGGLASREYLQKPSLWQPDGAHHVAKLVSLATPHGGSNASGFGLTSVDEKSEAVRDLRIYFSGAGKPGTYLFGSLENTTAIDVTYNNIDVNCNGISGDNTLVTGLNQKSIPTDVAYSCVIGTNSLLGGDGVVQVDQANLKNYYPTLAVDTFISKAPAFTFIWHTEVQKQTFTVLKAMDEPGSDEDYSVAFDKTYFGNFTVQSVGAASPVDRDNFGITAPVDGFLKINLFDLPLPNVALDIYGSGASHIYSGTSAAKGDTTFSVPVNAGDYQLTLSATADAASWLSPYAMRVGFVPNIVVPLSLLQFTATQNGENVQLHWLTANEINTDHFMIEHSMNGISWQPIGMQPAAKSAHENSYVFDHLKPGAGLHYYRLRILDANGQSDFSAIKMVNIVASQNLFSITPNPARNKTEIHFVKPVTAVNISIYNTRGQEVFIKSVNGTAIQSVDIPTSSFAAGIYFIRIHNGAQNTTQRLVVIK